MGINLGEGATLNNRYRILRVLSDKGGMGLVYQATDLSLSGTVVIKQSRFSDRNFLQQIFRNLSEDQLRAQADFWQKAFEREAKLLFGLRHNALPRVIDYFKTADGGQFLVMEFIPGKDFGDLLNERLKQNQGPFPLDQALDWADQILSALDYLHTQFDPPIIHRDIKPQNLKLMPNGQVVLLDFGLAKGARPGMSVVAGSIHGHTPHYAPLEQIRGKGTDVRSDLYSLAATIYHLLTGQMPPDAVERVTETISGGNDPLCPAHDLNPKIPSAVSEALQRAAALNQNDRYPAAAAFREALCQADKFPFFIEDLGKGVKLEMIFIPGGSFLMGSLDGLGNDNKNLSDLLDGSLLSSGMAFDDEKYQQAKLYFQAAVDSFKTVTQDVREVMALLLKALKEQYNFNRDAIQRMKPYIVRFVEEHTGLTGARAQPKPRPSATVMRIEGDEYPQHRVVLSQFYIGKYPVTQAQWNAVMGNNSNSSTEGDLPMEQVSWEDAVRFCEKLSIRTGKAYRLPTEAEWEYACCAGSTRKYCFGDDESLLGEYAWYSDNSGVEDHPVGKKKPNAWGLYDMHGSVWEWCQDVWHGNYEGAPADGSAWMNGGEPRRRVLRGGAWYSNPHSCRTAYRVSDELDARGFHFGFRVAMSTRTP